MYSRTHVKNQKLFIFFFCFLFLRTAKMLDYRIGINVLAACNTDVLSIEKRKRTVITIFKNKIVNNTIDYILLTSICEYCITNYSLLENINNNNYDKKNEEKCLGSILVYFIR